MKLLDRKPVHILFCFFHRIRFGQGRSIKRAHDICAMNFGAIFVDSKDTKPLARGFAFVGAKFNDVALVVTLGCRNRHIEILNKKEILA